MCQKHITVCLVRHQTCLLIVCAMIGGCQVNVERYNVGLDRPESGVTWSRPRALFQSLASRAKLAKSSTAVHGWIRTCNVAMKLETAGTESQNNCVRKCVRMMCQNCSRWYSVHSFRRA